MEKLVLQWHPAFCAAMRLDLWKDRDKLQFHDEYLLGKKPMQIDLVINVIEVLEKAEIKSVIGKDFKRFNIFEYITEKQFDQYFIIKKPKIAEQKNQVRISVMPS